MAVRATAAVQKAPAQKKASPLHWQWEAKTKTGELKKGEMEANDVEAVNNRLRSLGLNPTKVKKKPLQFRFKIPGIGGVRGKDLLVFTRQFATMIEPGLPLVPCPPIPDPHL